MKNFFVDETFYSDFEDFIAIRGFDTLEDLQELEDDWKVEVELCDLEPIFNIDADDLCQLLGDAYEHRLTEDESEKEKVMKALKECIDFEKLRGELPNLYYPNGKFETITKSDLISYFEDDSQTENQ